MPCRCVGVDGGDLHVVGVGCHVTDNTINVCRAGKCECSYPAHHVGGGDGGTVLAWAVGVQTWRLRRIWGIVTSMLMVSSLGGAG